MSHQIPFCEEKKIKSYSGYHEIYAKIFKPKHVEELQKLVKYFYKNNISYSIMGTGLSFNNAFQHQHIICCKKLNQLHLDLENNRILAQPGVTWGQVMKTIVPKGYVPPVVPTASNITVGGSFSCDTYSRMTATYGKEINQIISFKIIIPNGDILYASRSENEDLFYGAITGMGTIGIVIEIEERVVYVGKNPAFCSIVRRFDRTKGVRFLNPKMNFDQREEEDWKGSCAVFYHKKGNLCTLLAKHNWIDTTARNPTLVHQIKNPSRVIGDFLMHFFPKIAELSWDYYYKIIGKSANEEAIFIDSPYEASFVMETNTFSKAIARKLNIKLNMLQVTYAIPCSTNSETDRLKYEAFVQNCMHLLKKHQLHTVMIDGAHVPPSKTGLFSSSNSNQKSYLFTMTFEGLALRDYDTVRKTLEKISSICYHEYQGKIHLTKNVICPKNILKKMYAEAIEQLLVLKEKYDPKHLLQNNLLNELFDLQTLPTNPSPNTTTLLEQSY